jgi:LysM repeat protein
VRRMQALGGLVMLALAGGAHVSAPKATTHTVRAGETLAAIAARTGVPVASLAQANGIADVNRVRAGQVLTVPKPGQQAPAPAAPAAATTASYKVQPGDSLARVAKRTGVSVDALAKANGLKNANVVRVGQVLAVPKVGEPAPVVTAPLPALPSPVVVVGGSGEHRVARGQTLGAIARQYSTTVADLVGLNALKNPNLVREGAVLKVPGGEWLCPVKGTTQFADSWGQPRPGQRRHLGTDLFAARGTPVVASVSGTVTHLSGAVAGLAYYLAGDDGNTYYGAHLQSLAASGRVERGTVLGTVGSTGNAKGTTPHLHFEVKPGGGASVNPYPTLKAWC